MNLRSFLVLGMRNTNGNFHYGVYGRNSVPSKKLKYSNGIQFLEGIRLLTTDLVVPFSSEEEHIKACDKFIVLLLDTMSVVIEEKGWKDIKPIQMFDGMWGEIIKLKQFEEVYERFKETEGIINIFRQSEGPEKLVAKKELIERGIIQ